MIEQRDLASGTSSRSSKLIHGGLRYLEMFDFGLVREALEERGLLLTRLAPHLVRPVPFLYPLHHTWQRPYIGAGLLLYDGMAMAGKYDMGVPKHSHLFRKGVARIAPDLRTEDLKGAIRYYDAQVDDARLVLAVARTAASHGAHVAIRTRAVGFLREGERVVGVRAVDLESGRELEVRAKVVVNAAGVWTDEIQQMIGGRGALNVQASKGIHLVVPRDRIRSEAGLIARTETSVLFVIPWGAHWIIGTTDTDWNLDKAHPAASRADIDYLLTHVNTMLREPLDHDDVVGVYAGLRPLVRGAREPTSRISREHTVVAPVPGLVMIAGGKLTTYRVMAKDASTSRFPTPGSASPTASRWSAPTVTSPAPTSGCCSRVVPVSRCSASTTCSAATAAWSTRCSPCWPTAPSSAEPLEGAEEFLAAEVVYAVTHEGARHLDDVLTRRTRISIETFDRGVHAAGPAAAADGRRARLGRRAHRRRGRPLPAPRRGRAPEPDDAHRPGGRRGPGQRPRHRLTPVRWPGDVTHWVARQRDVTVHRPGSDVPTSSTLCGRARRFAAHAAT